MVVKYYLLMLLLVISLMNDILTQKVKNVVILPFLICGLILNGYFVGLAGLFDSLLAVIIPILILGIFFNLNMIGAGDIKLFSTIGAIMGVTFVSKTLIFSALTGGFIALIIIMFRQNARMRFKYLFTYLKRCLLTRSLPPYNSFCGEYNDYKFPYVYAIATGAMITLLVA